MSTAVEKATLRVLRRANTPRLDPADFVIDPASLAALEAAGTPSKYWKVSGDGLDIVEKDAGEKTTQDAADLPAYKAARCGAIDYQSGVLLSAGFTHATKTFSLSVTAQLKIMGLRVGILAGDIVDATADYPIDVSAMDETDYEIPDETDAKLYFKTGLDRVKDVLTGGASLKQEVIDAADAAAVDAVVDART